MFCHMGFHVRCSGARLLHSLRANASAFLGEPYSLYFVALATQVDDEALDWLYKYEMQLDSLCGPYAAFLLFYNQIRLGAEPGAEPEPESRIWATPPLDPEEVDFQYPSRLEEGVIQIELPPSVLNGGSGAVDGVLRYDPRAQTDKNILVTSMTYESDTVARELGIVDQLPCLVVFDDPASNDFYTLPLEKADGETLRDLRTLISKFLADRENVEFLDLLRSWHGHNARLENLQVQLKGLLESAPARPDFIYAELRRAKEQLLVGRTKDFRKVVNHMESKCGKVGSLPWKKLRAMTNDVATGLSLSRKILAPETSDEHRAASIERARELAGASAHIDGKTAAHLLTDHVGTVADSVIEVILDSLGLAPLEGGTPEPVQRVEEAIAAETATVRRLSHLLESMARPSLARHVTALNREKRNQRIVKGTRRVLAEASTRLPTIFDAVQKGVHLFS
jgi:hypothetical protein